MENADLNDFDLEDDAELTALEIEGWQEPGYPWLKIYTWIWVVATVLLAHSYLVLNKTHGKAGGFIGFLVRHHLLLAKGQSMAPDAGAPLSYRLGWLGFILIVLTNVYLVRRKYPALKKWGSLSAWLDSHIFFGLIGPTFIVFHTNFKVHGLVAITFWSMVISFASGVVGRYFYTQVLGRREDLKRELDEYRALFADWRKRGIVPDDGKTLEGMIERALTVVGVDQAIARGGADMLTVLWRSFVGDLRKRTWRVGRMRGIPPKMAPVLLGYAIAARRYLTARYYRRLIGYWHAFHKPFAVFMYVSVVFHIAAALIFRTKS